MVKYYNIIRIILLFMVTNTAYGENVEKYNWLASESAPKLYPMQIVRGNFLSQDGSSLYIPSGKTLLQGWGWPVSNHVVGPDLKSLPNKIEITFFSYLENQFYQGSFDLPYDKILSLFKAGYFSPNENSHITYDAIVAGIAPGGTVSVWLSGIDRETEVFQGKAKKIDGEWKWINDNPKYTRDEYIRLEIKDDLKPEELKAIDKNGIPFTSWEKYHKLRYYWYPKFIGIELRDDWIQNVKYYNGEEGYLGYPLSETELKKTRGIPEQIDFIWKYDEDTNYSYEMYFDEKEMFDVFEKYSSKNDPLELEIKMVKEGKKMNFTVALKNYIQDKGVYLKKVTIRSYGAD